MKGSDILLALFIVLIFVGLFTFNILTTGIANIKNNWPEYRCNPTVMPFASQFGVDPSENFTYCIQNMQTGFMGYLLQPVNYALTMVNSLGGEFTEAIQSIRNVINNIRNFVAEIVQSIFGVFLNILIQFQKIIIAMKDMVGKIVGIITTLLYTIDGVVKAMQSAWGSPAGGVMRALCFMPNTLVKLKNGKIVQMKDLDLGDVLINNSMVCATMQIKNYIGSKKKFSENDWQQIESIYKLKGGVANAPIYVTGTHLVQHNGLWIPVKDHPDAVLTNIKTKVLSCLITSDHLIPIGSHIFHDWEDDNGSPSKDLDDNSRVMNYV